MALQKWLVNVVTVENKKIPAMENRGDVDTPPQLIHNVLLSQDTTNVVVNTDTDNKETTDNPG